MRGVSGFFNTFGQLRVRMLSALERYIQKSKARMLEALEYVQGCGAGFECGPSHWEFGCGDVQSGPFSLPKNENESGGRPLDVANCVPHLGNLLRY